MKLKIIRFKTIKNGTLGEFTLLDDKSKELMKGYTLEPAGPDTVEPNQDKRIPQGIYKAKMEYSPRYKRDLPVLWNNLVSKDRRILIHSGNTDKDTLGCILVGSMYGLNSISNSRKTLEDLLYYVDDYEIFEVEIINDVD